MHNYVLSEAADGDIQDMARKAVAQWGFARAQRHMMQLRDAFETLGEFPHLGRDVGDLRPGYRCYDHASRSVFFQTTGEGIFIVRVLQRVSATPHS